MRTYICFLLLFAALWLASPVRAGEADATTHGAVVKIYDGDTITVALPELPPWLGKEMGVRVLGVDTPEMKDKRPEIKALAIQARDLVRSMCPIDSEVVLSDIEPGKYFRIVARVTCKGGDIGRALLDAGLAHPYDGGTKIPWELSSQSPQ